MGKYSNCVLHLRWILLIYPLFRIVVLSDDMVRNLAHCVQEVPNIAF
jgi:hypothetical protein